MGNLSILEEDIERTLSDKDLFEKLRDSTVLVTGATGLIGSMLVKTLHVANDKYGLNIKIYGQIRNKEKADKLFEGLLPADDISLIFSETIICDYIIHTVSPTISKFFVEHPVETIKSSIESTMRILEIARKNKASIVYLSSMEQYGIPYESGEVMSENKVGIIDHLNIRSSYSESKRMCECLCASYVAEYGVEAKIARLAQTFGAGIPLSDNRMPMQFARAVVENRDIILHTEGKSISNFSYLSDTISGILTILAYGEAGEAYNICNDKETRSVKEVAELVADKVANGNIGVKIVIPEGVNLGYAPDVKMYLCSDKLRNLGWNAKIDMADAYVRLVNYLKLS